MTSKSISDMQREMLSNSVTALTETVSDDTSVSAVATILAANTSRKGFKIQNVDAANAIRFTTDGSTPTASHGSQLKAGATYESLVGNVPTGAIKAIKEGASAASVSVTEYT